MLSPFLFTLYISDFQRNSESCHLQMYSDDSAVPGCISDGREEVWREPFVSKCERDQRGSDRLQEEEEEGGDATRVRPGTRMLM